MIKLKIPIEKIPYIRTIEGRKFKDGYWFFPDSSLDKLKEFELVSNDLKVQRKEFKQFDISDFLYKYQIDIVNKALNYGSYGIFVWWIVHHNSYILFSY